MMLRHDPTFEGLLSAIAICLHDRVVPEALIPDLDQQTLLPCTDAPLVPDIRARFRSQLARHMSAAKAEQVFKTAWHAFLSDDEGIGLAIYRFLAAALKRRDDPSGDLLDRDIARVVRMAAKTARQSHAFLGLLRFRTIGPSLYLADFSPEHHVLPLILPHFCERLPDQCFVIRDLRRGLAALHLPRRAPQIFVLAPPGAGDPSMDGTPSIGSSSALGGFLAMGGGAGLPGADRQLALPMPASAAGSSGESQHAAGAEDSSGEPQHAAGMVDLAASGSADKTLEDFDEMWRRYLAALTIPERRNLRLQRAHMPKKYWKYLTEQPGRS